jgi:hypothetical protein
VTLIWILERERELAQDRSEWHNWLVGWLDVQDSLIKGTVVRYWGRILQLNKHIETVIENSSLHFWFYLYKGRTLLSVRKICSYVNHLSSTKSSVKAKSCLTLIHSSVYKCKYIIHISILTTNVSRILKFVTANRPTFGNTQPPIQRVLLPLPLMSISNTVLCWLLFSS